MPVGLMSEYGGPLDLQVELKCKPVRGSLTQVVRRFIGDSEEFSLVWGGSAVALAQQ